MKRLTHLIRRYGPGLVMVGLALAFPLSIFAYIKGTNEATQRAHDAQVFARRTRVLALEISATANEATQLARSNQAQILKAKRLAEELATQRLEECRRDNSRHVNTVKAFDHLILRAEHRAKTPVRRFQIQQQAHSTMLLINALAPIRRC